MRLRAGVENNVIAHIRGHSLYKLKVKYIALFYGRSISRTMIGSENVPSEASEKLYIYVTSLFMLVSVIAMF